MPICLPPAEKFPDEKGIVYVAGWGLHHESTQQKDCTTGDKGPDPFSKCKFPFFLADALSLPFKNCISTKSPSAKIKGCHLLYKMMIKRKGNNASFIDESYGRVNTDMLNCVQVLMNPFLNCICLHKFILLQMSGGFCLLI